MENNEQHKGVVRHDSMNGIRDGFSNTLMLPENVRTGRATTLSGTGTIEETWPTPFAHRTAVFFDSSVCTVNLCSAGNVDQSRANGAPNGINSGLPKAEGQSPFANSRHAGYVNVAYADGSVTGLSENVDGQVYAALMSPSSTILDQTPLRQIIPSADQF